MKKCVNWRLSSDADSANCVTNTARKIKIPAQIANPMKMAQKGATESQSPQARAVLVPRRTRKEGEVAQTRRQDTESVSRRA